MNYFYLGKLDLSQKYLTLAARLDPGHFSHPQLLLAEIYWSPAGALRRGGRAGGVSTVSSGLAGGGWDQGADRAAASGGGLDADSEVNRTGRFAP